MDTRGARRPMAGPFARILVALFVAVIFLPLALNVTGRDGADAAAENRELAPFPHMTGTMKAIGGFAPALSAWFEDHFGLRSTLVRWYGETRLLWFGVSPTPTVFAGTDGWFYYADDKAAEDYASNDPLTPEAIANWREALVRAHRWLSARGIGYVFVIAPDKHVIYPEHMPPSIARVGAMSRTDQLYGSLQDLGIMVDVRPALWSAKAGERLYEKTDTHWNDRGAFVAYQAIVNAARAQVAAIPPPWSRGDFEAAERQVDGMDLAGMMGLKRALQETDLVLVPKRPRRARVIEPAGADASSEEGRIVTEISGEAGSTLPRAVIFRDSFMSRVAPFLSEHFSRAVYLWQNDFDAQVVEQERPAIVIQEIVGRHLYNFIPSPELVPSR